MLSTASFANKKEYHFEAFGDSITAGGLAAIPLSKEILAGPKSIDETDVINMNEKKGFWAWLSRSFYTFLVDTFSHTKYSWAGGKKIYSLKDFFKNEMGYTKLKYKMRAVGGATTKGFLEQVKKSKAEQIKKDYELDIATVLIGANNYCHKLPDFNQASAELKEGLDLLLQDTETKVVFVQMPDANMVRPIAKKKTLLNRLTCEALWNWKKFYCHRILHNDEDWAREEVKSWLAGWEEIARDYQNRYPERFFIGSMSEDIHPSDIAADCFHPSKYGQQKISANVMTQIKEQGFPEAF
jgi:lysophospholipase L1-like esterase